MKYVNNAIVKNCVRVEIPDFVLVDKVQYEVIGSITHQGTAYAGHNRAYQKEDMQWYVFEDHFPSRPRKPVDNEGEQNYCLLLRKVDTAAPENDTMIINPPPSSEPSLQSSRQSSRQPPQKTPTQSTLLTTCWGSMVT